MAEEKKDKAEYELDLASDCGWVRGLDAAGKPIRISKTDMVELIRANMPAATVDKSGLMSHFDKKHMKYNPFFTEEFIDCNTLKNNESIASARWINHPGGSVAILEVKTCTLDWVLQEFTTIDSISQKWIRTFYGGTTWTNWIKVR